jgi:hypothetical protein
MRTGQQPMRTMLIHVVVVCERHTQSEVTRMTVQQLIEALQNCGHDPDAEVEVRVLPRHNVSDNSWWEIKKVESWKTGPTSVCRKAPVLLNLGRLMMG